MIPGSYFPVPYLWLPLNSVPQTALGGTVYNVPCGRVVSEYTSREEIRQP